MNQEIIDLTHWLLLSISQGDWDTYAQLCDPSLTCFEPEAQGQRVEGLDFHRFYFDLHTEKNSPQANVTITSPHVRMIGNDVAIISYNKLLQSATGGSPQTLSFVETRVWQKQDGHWKNVHFHLSHPTKPRRWHRKRDG